jgi:hypothetical protein
MASRMSRQMAAMCSFVDWGSPGMISCVNTSLNRHLVPSLVLAASCARVGFEHGLEATSSDSGCPERNSFTEQCLKGDVSHQRTVDVATTAELLNAVAGAQPGDLIRVADGQYDLDTLAKLLTMTVSGTSTDPIFLCGTKSAILDGGVDAYPQAITLRASYWNIVGLTIRDFYRAIYVDGGSNNALRELEVYNTGSDMIRLQHFSTDNLIADSCLHDSGLTSDQYASGILVAYDDGTGEAGCDRTQIIGNHFGPNIRSDAVEIHADNVDGLVSENVFDGEGQVYNPAYGTLAWVDITSHGITVSKNSGRTAAQHGFAAVRSYVGAPNGDDNVFVDNVADLGGSAGYGFYIDPSTSGNVVDCNNTVKDAASGTWNIPCQP